MPPKRPEVRDLRLEERRTSLFQLSQDLRGSAVFSLSLWERVRVRD
jgi:hypothetical protein